MAILFLGITSCSSPSEKMAPKGGIIEEISFNAKANVDASAFQLRDATTEKDFTSKQPEFMKRLSAINEKGEYVVVVYWKSICRRLCSYD